MSCSTRMMALTPAALAAPIRVFMSPCFSALDTPDVGSSSRITSRRQRKGGRDVEQLLLALREHARGALQPVLQAEDAGDLLHARAHGRVLGHAREQPPLLALLGHDGSGDGLGHGQLREDLHELEGAGHAACGERHRALAGDVPAPEVDLALGRYQQAGEQIDERGLAGAVGPHDRDELALADGQRHVVERLEGTVVLGHAPGLDERRHAASP